MKKSMGWILLMGIICGVASNGWAAPERMQIKEESKRAKEISARALIKTIDLQNIEDPEARKAIREILNYLDLKSKN